MLLTSSTLLMIAAAAVVFCSTLVNNVYAQAPAPTRKPSVQPTFVPSLCPTRFPTPKPSLQPSTASVTTHSPTAKPTTIPTARPSPKPTAMPNDPTSKPTPKPTYVPTALPTAKPSAKPSPIPTAKPSPVPTASPSTPVTAKPTATPTSFSPIFPPTIAPSAEPTQTKYPTSRPTSRPSSRPSKKPTPKPTAIPSFAPSPKPTADPTAPGGSAQTPTSRPSRQPSAQPVMDPTSLPSGQPSFNPSSPSSQPSTQPSGSPTLKPTPSPSTADPTFIPTVYTASVAPSPLPTASPTAPYGTARPSGVYERFDSTGVVTFNPDTEELCNDLEISITFNLKQIYNTRYPLIISAPGITSGPCNRYEQGTNITEILVRTSPISNMFTVDFNEGRYENFFYESVLSVTLNDPVNNPFNANTNYQLIIDRSVGLRRVCYSNSTWKVQTKTPDGRIAYTGKLTLNEVYVKKCFMFHTRLQFVSPTMQYFAGINISLYPGFSIDQSTRFDIALPGFTSYWWTKYPLNQGIYNSSSEYQYRKGPELVFTDYQTNSGTNWTIRWWEGGKKGPNMGHMKFNNHTFIRLSLPKGNLALKEYWVYIPRTSHIIPRCGVPTNYEGFTYQATSKKFFINTTTFDQSDAIGSGCKDKSRCNGHGKCDYCTQNCQCYDGYGSANDFKYAISNDFQPDCSARACPVGRSHGSISNSYGSEGAMHPLKECSSNGVCNRESGECECFDGFGGSACEKMDCPTGSNGKVCSGRGICTSIKALTYKKSALPLMKWTGNFTYGFRRDTYSATNTWDADMGRMCLCDSSWVVGFRSGERQTAEYFGPACEYRHCPTGDDPFTRSVETNCEGKPTGGGINVGAAGNLCHVDCSNRGVCDYSTGECTCLPGYFGINCGMRSRIAGHITKYTHDYDQNGVFTPYYRDLPKPGTYFQGPGIEPFLPQN